MKLIAVREAKKVSGLRQDDRGEAAGGDEAASDEESAHVRSDWIIFRKSAESDNSRRAKEERPLC